mmetsp:Transcript_30644/g.99504  ORF Transcript_30644/g.99504 Transcript_30644/m.99504 type:complete len:204 (-) Transcript_30644:312-923(-)
MDGAACHGFSSVSSNANHLARALIAVGAAFLCASSPRSASIAVLSLSSGLTAMKASSATCRQAQAALANGGDTDSRADAPLRSVARRESAYLLGEMDLYEPLPDFSALTRESIAATPLAPLSTSACPPRRQGAVTRQVNSIRAAFTHAPATRAAAGQDSPPSRRVRRASSASASSNALMCAGGTSTARTIAWYIHWSYLLLSS